MASTFSRLKIELIGTGEQAGTWGLTTNNNLGSSSTYRGLEQAIVGMATLETADFTSNSYTLPYTDSNDAQDFRCLVLDITATLSAAGTVNVPAIQKPYIVMNNSVGGYAVTVKVTGQTGVSVPNGAKVMLYNNGTDVGAAVTYLTTLTLGSPLAVGSGGTGISSGTSGGVPYFSGTSTIASSGALAANALVVGGGAGSAPSTVTTGANVITALGVNVGSAGAVVVNGGALGTPSSGTLTNATGLPLSTGVTGTLSATNGGTAQSTYTTGDILYASATNTLSKLPVGTTGQVLTISAGVLAWGASSGGISTGKSIAMAMIFGF